MAYNKIKVAGQSPNNAGEITVNVEDLDDVDGDLVNIVLV